MPRTREQRTGGKLRSLPAIKKIKRDSKTAPLALSQPEYTSETCRAAAERGDLGYLQSAHKAGCVFTADICQAAAAAGQLQTMYWTGDHGCPMSQELTLHAAKMNDIGMLQWLIAKKCPWHNQVCFVANQNEFYEFRDIAYDNGCSMGPSYF